METQLRLQWIASGKPVRKGFKSEAAYALLSDYASRLAQFAPFHVAGQLHEPEKDANGRKIWICDRQPGAKVLSSEDLAERLSQVMNQGTRRLEILIGGADGFSDQELKALKPDLRWSFGPLTLAHELASVVACEQLYRAWTIIRHLPYHRGSNKGTP